MSAVVDLSEMFPDYERADGELIPPDGNLVLVRLHQGGSFSTIEMWIDKMANALDKLRASAR